MVWLVGSSVCYNFLPDHLLPKASSSLASFSIATFCSEELLKGAKLKNPPIDLLKIKIARLSNRKYVKLGWLKVYLSTEHLLKDILAGCYSKEHVYFFTPR